MSAASNPVYCTAPLDLASKAIRLVEVLAGDEPDVIACKFHGQMLHDFPTYSALSYTWGNSNNMKDLLIDGRVFKVRENLWQFLRQVREEGTAALFWIDAICIYLDQSLAKDRRKLRI